MDLHSFYKSASSSHQSCSTSIDSSSSSSNDAESDKMKSTKVKTLSTISQKCDNIWIENIFACNR